MHAHNPLYIYIYGVFSNFSYFAYLRMCGGVGERKYWEKILVGNKGGGVVSGEKKVRKERVWEEVGG